MRTRAHRIMSGMPDTVRDPALRAGRGRGTAWNALCFVGRLITSPAASAWARHGDEDFVRVAHRFRTLRRRCDAIAKRLEPILWMQVRSPERRIVHVGL